MIRGIIFDLDGTLVDTITDIALGMNKFLTARAWPVHTTDQYRIMVGRGLLNLIRAAVPQEEAHRAEELFEEAHAAYSSVGTANSLPYPHVHDSLRILTQKGIHLAVLSNKPDDLTKSMIKELFPDIPFKMVQGGTEGVPHKPHPGMALKAAEVFGLKAAECAFLGDSDVDIKTALAAGMQPIGAAWGFRAKEELLKAGAKTVLATFKDILNFV
ncbi:HAD family hydrolase [Spirochaetota bacterium]